MEKDDHYLLSMDVPGVTKEDINIEVADSRLKISGERRDLFEEEGCTQEGYGRFERAFGLHSDIDTTGIAAHCENGVLTVALPKTKKAEASKIPISDGTKGGFWSRIRKTDNKS